MSIIVNTNCVSIMPTPCPAWEQDLQLCSASHTWRSVDWLVDNCGSRGSIDFLTKPVCACCWFGSSLPSQTLSVPQHWSLSVLACMLHTAWKWLVLWNGMGLHGYKTSLGVGLEITRFVTVLVWLWAILLFHADQKSNLGMSYVP